MCEARNITVRKSCYFIVMHIYSDNVWISGEIWECFESSSIQDKEPQKWAHVYNVIWRDGKIDLIKMEVLEKEGCAGEVCVCSRLEELLGSHVVQVSEAAFHSISQIVQ